MSIETNFQGHHPTLSFKDRWLSPLYNQAKHAYLKYSKPVAYAAMAALGVYRAGFVYAGAADLSYGIKPFCLFAVNAVAAIACTFLAGKALKEEVEIEKNKHKLVALASEINEAAAAHFPLVAILHCESDENGAFDVVQSRFRFLKGSCRVCLVSISNPEQITDSLKEMAKKNPVDYAVLSGHGTKDSVIFRDDFFGVGSLSPSKITPQMFQFVQKGLLIDACLTGSPGGLAKQISSVFGHAVQGSSIAFDSAGGWLIHDPKWGLLLLVVDNDLNIVTKVYRNGKEIPFPEIDLLNLAKVAETAKDASLMTFVSLAYLNQNNIEKSRSIIHEAFKLDLPRGLRNYIFEVQSKIVERLNPRFGPQTVQIS